MRALAALGLLVLLVAGCSRPPPAGGADPDLVPAPLAIQQCQAMNQGFAAPGASAGSTSAGDYVRACMERAGYLFRPGPACPATNDAAATNQLDQQPGCYSPMQAPQL